MAAIPKTFEEALLAIGCPPDRVGLVKRNLDLKMKCKQRGTMIHTLTRATHDVMDKSHTGPYETCENTVCSEVRKFLDMTDPEKDKP